MRRRNYCFTIYPDPPAEDNNYENFISPDDRIRCAVWQLERCPRTERIHLQGYIEFTSSMRLSACKDALRSPTAHLEARQGTRDQAIAYCRKDESRIAGPWQYGDLSKLRPGKRTDLDTIAHLLLDGSSIDDVMQEYPGHYIRYRRGMEALVNRRARKAGLSWRAQTVLVYWGDSGTGKTRKAIEDSGESFFILDQGERVWFDGYEGERTLIIDDFYGWIKYGQLLRILDGHPYRAEIKCSHTWALWTTVIITSNKPPAEWYGAGLTPALSRRITSVLHFAALVN